MPIKRRTIIDPKFSGREVWNLVVSAKSISFELSRFFGIFFNYFFTELRHKIFSNLAIVYKCEEFIKCVEAIEERYKNEEFIKRGDEYNFILFYSGTASPIRRKINSKTLNFLSLLLNDWFLTTNSFYQQQTRPIMQWLEEKSRKSRTRCQLVLQLHGIVSRCVIIGRVRGYLLEIL